MPPVVTLTAAFVPTTMHTVRDVATHKIIHIAQSMAVVSYVTWRNVRVVLESTNVLDATPDTLSTTRHINAILSYATSQDAKHAKTPLPAHTATHHTISMDHSAYHVALLTVRCVTQLVAIRVILGTNLW